MHRRWWLALAAAAQATAQSASLTFDGSAPPLHVVRPSYLSLNVDSGSLFQAFDFDDGPLTTLVSHLALAAPMELRIGGGAADGVLFTGPGGASGNCTFAQDPDVNICVSGESLDAILRFCQRTGVGLVFDLNGARRAGADSPWNSTNAQQLLAWAADAPSRGLPVPAGWQLGNEPEDWYKRRPALNVSGATLAADFHALRALLRAQPALAASAILGPDACCEDRRPLLADFAAHAAGALDAVTVHAYPLPRAANDSCLPAGYTNKSAMLGVVDAVLGYALAAAPLLARGVPLILGETATSAHGGCDGLSNTFVAGFTFMLELGTLGEVGVAQINRQDLAGFSSNTEPSNYGLLGPPGWSRGPLGQPHPDYWTALLWKQLVGTRVLAASLQADGAPLLASLDAHVWCAAGPSGALVVTFFSMADVPTALALPPGVPTAPRVEYVLTSSSLTSNDAYLNGALLVAGPDGSVPALDGRRVAAGGDQIKLPPWSYGFLVLEGAGAVPACAQLTRARTRFE